MQKAFLIIGLFFSILYHGFLYAQSDSLSKKELFRQKNRLFNAEHAAMNKGFRESSIGMFLIADSLSHRHDSVGASIALMKVNPLHFSAFLDLQGISPATKYLQKLNLTSVARNSYEEELQKAIKKKPEIQYTIF